MKILVTGGGGFIGSNLIRRLVADGHQVVGLDTVIRPNTCSLSEMQWLKGDFSGSTGIANALKNVDVVYHLAWTTIPATSNMNPVFDISTNLTGSVRLIEDCIANGVKRVVFASTGGAIYGDTGLDFISETCQTNPQCSYGITKMAVEKYLSMYAYLKKIDCVSLRISNAYGPHQDPESRVGFIGAALAAAVDGRLLTIWGEGDVVRDYVYVDDIVAALAMSNKSTFAPGVYHVSSGTGISINELVTIIEATLSLPLNVRRTSGRDFDVKKVVLDNAKIRAQGWEPKTNIRAGIKKTWEWLMLHGKSHQCGANGE